MAADEEFSDLILWCWDMIIGQQELVMTRLVYTEGAVGPMDALDRVNTAGAKATIFGWFAGLAWVAYSDSVVGLSWIDWALLIVVGMFAASIVIGGALAGLAALLTKAIVGRPDATPALFGWVALIGPIVAFFCAAPVARLLA